MSDLNPEPDKTKFEIGFDAKDPEIMMIQVPIGVWARDMENGVALLHGKLREAEAIGARVLREKRVKQANAGLIKAAPTLGVH